MDERKPWEETWTPTLWMHDADQRPVWAVESDADERWPIFEGTPPDNEAHARLAAAAPEMARLLLSIEWFGYDGTSACCPSCMAEPRDGHGANCQLAFVLRKAGVLA